MFVLKLTLSFRKEIGKKLCRFVQHQRNINLPYLSSQWSPLLLQPARRLSWRVLLMPSHVLYLNEGKTKPPMGELSHAQCCCPVYKARTRCWDAATPTCRMRSPELWQSRVVLSEHPRYPTCLLARDSAGHTSPWEQQLSSQTKGPVNPVSWPSRWPKVDVQVRV